MLYGETAPIWQQIVDDRGRNSNPSKAEALRDLEELLYKFQKGPSDADQRCSSNGRAARRPNGDLAAYMKHLTERCPTRKANSSSLRHSQNNLENI